MNCFFCHGESGSALSREHLLSNPICDFFGIDRATTTLGRVDSTGSGQAVSSIASLETTTVRLVCEKCNNGWMSELEGATVEVLDRWVNAAAPLQDSDVKVLKSWLAKSHLLLCVIEGGVRGFVANPETGVIPDATLARRLFEQADDAPDAVTVGIGVPRSPRLLYAFGNPRPLCSGPTPVTNRAATVSYWNLGQLQMWTGISTLPSRFRLPGRLTNLRSGVRYSRLRTVDGNADPTIAQVDYGDLDLSTLLTALSEFAHDRVGES